MQEFVDVDTERLAQLIGHKEGRTKLSALEPRHVVRRQTRGLGELHLRPTSPLASAPHALADRNRECARIVRGVTGMMRWPRAHDRALLHRPSI